MTRVSSLEIEYEVSSVVSSLEIEEEVSSVVFSCLIHFMGFMIFSTTGVLVVMTV